MVATPTSFSSPLLAPQMSLGQRLIHAVGHCTESRQMLLCMAEMIGQVLQVEICVLLVKNSEKSSLQGVVWSELSSTRSQTVLLGAGSRWLKHSWLREIQLKEYPLLLNLEANPPKTVQLTKKVILRSGLGLRTVFQGKVNGMIIVGSSQQKDYSLEVAKLIEIADNLAIANCFLQNSLFIPKIKAETAQNIIPSHNLTTDENPIIKAWYEATHQKLERQQRSNEQLIHNIVTIMSDQTRNPLTNIRMGIEMLRKNPPSPESLNQRLDVIEQEWRKLNEINEKILQLKTLKFNHINLQFSQINLNDFVRQLVTNYESKWAENSNPLTIKTDLPQKLLFLDSNASYLQRIFDELFINAKKFAKKHTDIILTLKEFQEKDQSYIVLKLTNSTQTVRCENLRHFFDPFYREQWVIDTAISGIGLGLTIAKELVEQLNGKIRTNCDSKDNSNNCLITFTITFPSNCSG